jgi:ornithine carbamoyltransferase
VADNVDVPVINGLSDQSHPCQAVADLLTIREKVGRVEGAKVAYVGDANNVCRSLACALVKCGGSITIASPEGYRLPESFVGALETGDALKEVADPAEAVEGADAIYTDVWTSMGQEHEAAERNIVFKPYQVNQELLNKSPKAVVMHCLPAHRGQEITDEVLDGPQSVVYDQAENRLHMQRALLCKLIERQPAS